MILITSNKNNIFQYMNIKKRNKAELYFWQTPIFDSERKKFTKNVRVDRAQRQCIPISIAYFIEMDKCANVEDIGFTGKKEAQSAMN